MDVPIAVSLIVTVLGMKTEAKERTNHTMSEKRKKHRHRYIEHRSKMRGWNFCTVYYECKCGKRKP